MQLNKVRANQVRDNILAECDKRGIIKTFAKEAVDYAEYLLNEHHLLVGTATDKGLQIAIARQLRLDDHNRALLRQVIGTN